MREHTMKLSRTQRLVISGLLLATGIILPYFTSHMFGIPGTILLPMHIPVLLTGLLCGPVYGAVNGVIIPLLSSLLTGMPPVFPMLPIMAFELLTYGLISGLIFKKTKKIYLSMLPAMVAGRVVYGLVFTSLVAITGSEIKALSVTAAFVQGLPGIAIQLVLIPLIVAAILRSRKKSNGSTDDSKPTQLNEAKRRIQTGEASCVVMKNGIIIKEAVGNGVKPIIALLENEPELLKDAQIVDKVIGKAAAMLLVLGDVDYVYGVTMSVAGKEYLEAHNIKAEYSRCIDVISNRTGNGICPLEKSVLDIGDPEAGYQQLKETISQLMAAN